MQETYEKTENFREDPLKLNLQRNDDGIYECRGRIKRKYPVYLLPKVSLSEKIVQDAHELTLHGGVGVTMTFVRRNYWIPLNFTPRHFTNHHLETYRSNILKARRRFK